MTHSPKHKDLVHTGPDTLAGDYLRRSGSLCIVRTIFPPDALSRCEF